MTKQRVRRKEEKVPLCYDGRKMRRIEPPKQLATGHKNIAVTWTILHQLTCHTSSHGNGDQGMKTNCLALKLRDGKHPGRMTGREDFPQAAHALGALQRQQGRVHPHIPKDERERQ